MKLFFETGRQAVVYLMTIPVGLLLGVLLESEKPTGAARFCLDLISILFCGAAFFLFFLLLSNEILRLYHLLGLISGMLLYYGGISRLRHKFRSISLRKKAGYQQE